MADYCMDCAGHDNPGCLCKYAPHPAPELMDFLEKGEAAELAKEYHEGGYIGISNKYHTIGRPDRNDWHIAQAEILRCAPADFYLRDGSGKLCPRWREHYIRCITTDKIEVSELVYDYLKKMQNSG